MHRICTAAGEGKSEIRHHQAYDQTGAADGSSSRAHHLDTLPGNRRKKHSSSLTPWEQNHVSAIPVRARFMLAGPVIYMVELFTPLASPLRASGGLPLLSMPPRGSEDLQELHVSVGSQPTYDPKSQANPGKSYMLRVTAYL